jgi:transcription elongation GreA/GreB family factor
MRLPKRTSELFKKNTDDPVLHLTSDAHEQIKRELGDLQKRQRPQAVEDVSRSRELGDLSENAEYREARHRLSRIDGRIFHLTERLKRVILIEKNLETDGRVRLGSNVTVEVDGQTKTYSIVGPHESNPSYGRISHVSPLGSALLNHVAGERITIPLQNREATYEIKTVT